MKPLLGVVAMSLTISTVLADSDGLAGQAQAAWRKGQRAQALELAGKAIAAEPKNAKLLLLRAQMHEQLKKHAEAIADCDAAIKLDPKLAFAYDLRGSEQFKLGKVAESVADFDRFIELEPRAANGHWKRGISLFYLGRFADGKKQFNAYESVDTNDVENAVWHFLCNAKATSLEQARKEILKIGKDKRTPMMEVYALFKGELKPADVLAAAEGGDVPDEQRKSQLFYAHLYLGLYHDILGDKKKALEHMTPAAHKHRIGHYMGDVAWVHEQILLKK